ncbi:MAG: DUF433 domain-containing protein [Burkholderiales bacterium]|nr:DUF433 domain-containing protein [Burkholderiales bacterium]
MELNERIVADAGICGGRPRVKGTGISVEFLLQLKASGWSEARILENHPNLSDEDLRAAFAYVRALLDRLGSAATGSANTVTALKGILPKPKRPVSLEEMDRAIADGAARK